MEHEGPRPGGKEITLNPSIIKMIEQKGQSGVQKEVWELYQAQVGNKPVEPSPVSVEPSTAKTVAVEPEVAAPTVENAPEAELPVEKIDENDVDVALNILGEKKEGLIWDEKLPEELLEATRFPRVWKNPRKKNLGKRPDNQIEADERKINESIEKLRVRGVIVNKLVDKNLRGEVADARRLVFDHETSVRSGMDIARAEEILRDEMKIDISKVGGESKNKTVEESEVDKLIKAEADYFKNRFSRTRGDEVTADDDKRDWSDSKRILEAAGYSPIKIAEWEAQIAAGGNSVEAFDAIDEAFEEAKKIYEWTTDKINADPELRSKILEAEAIYALTENPSFRFDEMKLLLKNAKTPSTRAWIFKQMTELKELASINPEAASAKLEDLSNTMIYANETNRRSAAKRWLELYKGKSGIPKSWAREAEKILKGEEISFKTETESGISEEDQIRNFCLEEVFDRNANAAQDIYNRLTGPNGFLQTTLDKTPEQEMALRKKAREIVDSLGLDNFISMRKVGAEWDRLKQQVEDITSSSLKSSLFVPQLTEMWFAGVYVDGDRKEERMVNIPGKGKVNIEVEVSSAMLQLKNFFDNVEYWDYVGVAAEKKIKLFEQLNINRYVGEVAFNMAMSNLIFTETRGTGLDPFLLMTFGDIKRRKARDVAVDRELTGMAYAQRIMADEGRTPNNDEIEEWLLHNFPSRLVPTGLSRGGRSALEEGNWLYWRVEENLFPAAQRAMDVTYETSKTKWQKVAEDGFMVNGHLVQWTAEKLQYEYDKRKNKKIIGAKGRLEKERSMEVLRERNFDEWRRVTTAEKEIDNQWKALVAQVSAKVHISTDTETRVEEMKTALDLLTALKDALKPESDIDKMGVLKSKMLIHWLTSMKAAGLVDENNMISQEFSFIEGQKQSVDEWVSQAILTACESWLHSHSLLNFKNPKPLEMVVLAEKAEQFLATDVQTPDIQAYLWLGKDKDKPEALLDNKRAYLRYVDLFWNDCYKIIDLVKAGKGPEKYPKWWNAGVYPPASVIEVIKKSSAFYAKWWAKSERWSRV